MVASIRVAGKQEPWSTNFDLYRFDAAGKQAPVNLTASNPAWMPALCSVRTARLCSTVR